MPVRFHIGAKELRGAITAYAKRFDYLEVAIGLAPKSTAKEPRTAPAAATLRKWRKDVPPHFDFGVIAGPAVCALRAGDALEHELAAARSAVDALRARCLILKTPTDVSPAPVWRDRMAKLLDRLPRDATHVVWQPTGIWEVEDAAVAAKKWGIVLAVDPSREPVPAGPVAYARLRAMGETRSFGPAALERVATKIGERRDAYVVLETDGALGEAKKLRTLVQQGAANGGGFARVVRPRGALRVRDDEQE
ncbi:MAG: DUF72 domain-containing protein [Polyangiaceae bacterium]